MRSLAQYKKEALRGVVIAAQMISGIITLGLLLASSAVLAGNQPGPMGRAGAYVCFVVGLGIVVATIDAWKKWLFAFIGVRGVIGGFGVLASGHRLAWPYTPIPPYESLLLLLFSIALIGTSYPLLNMRRQLDGADKALLVGSLIAFCFSLVQGREVGIWIWASLCVVLLVVFRLRNRLRTRHKARSVQAHYESRQSR